MMRMRSALLPVLLVALAFPGAAAGQTVTQIERDRARTMIGGLYWVLDTLYFDKAAIGDGTLGARLQWDAFKVVDTAQSWPVMLYAMYQFLDGFNDSHTRFLPPNFSIEVDFEWTWTPVGDDCYVTRVGGRARDAGLQVGDRVVNIDGIRATPENMEDIWYVYRLIVPRRSMRVVVQRPDGSRQPVTVEARVRQRSAVIDYGNLDHVRMLMDQATLETRVEHKWVTRDSVAIWRFSQFGIRDRGNLDARMREARRYPWLILDLRDNPGGVIETLTGLLGHFFRDSVVAFEQRWRDSTTTYRVSPRNDAYGGNVIVLVNRASASSAELLARVLQLEGRATVIGDRTAGQVRTAIPYPMEEHASGQFYSFGLVLSVADMVMADGQGLEGRGVTPDLVVLPTGADLAAGHDPVLQRALERAGITVSAAEAGRILR